jgi:hypothetical protein
LYSSKTALEVKGLTRSKIPFVEFIVTFLFSITTGQDQQQFPAFRQANVMSKLNSISIIMAA